MSSVLLFMELSPRLPRITHCRTLTEGNGSRPIIDGQRFEERMDSRWNWFIDNVPVRVALNTIVWCLWIAATVGILEFAAKF